MSVLDASALLAFLQGEKGADIVRRELTEGAACGAANWSETAAQVRAHGGDWDLCRALLSSYGLTVEPVTIEDAEAAASLWRRGAGLSLGDRLCIALGERLDTSIWTADRDWGTKGRIRQIR